MRVAADEIEVDLFIDIVEQGKRRGVDKHARRAEQAEKPDPERLSPPEAPLASRWLRGNIRRQFARLLLRGRDLFARTSGHLFHA